MHFPLSASQISTYQMCARKYGFRYVDHVEPAFKSAALGFGSACHATLQHFHEERKEDRTPTADELQRMFACDWNAEQDEPLRFKSGGDATTLLDVGSRPRRPTTGSSWAWCGTSVVRSTRVRSRPTRRS